MIKRLIHAALKTVLDELFIGAGNDALRFDLLGRDMFSDSSIRLTDLNMRPDLFDICLFPLKLTSGNIRMIQIEGIAESYLGGVIKVSVDQIYLLFSIETYAADVEKIQVMKKLFIELQSGKIFDNVAKELMKV